MPLKKNIIRVEGTITTTTTTTTTTSAAAAAATVVAVAIGTVVSPHLRWSAGTVV